MVYVITYIYVVIWVNLGAQAVKQNEAATVSTITKSNPIKWETSQCRILEDVNN